MNAEQYRNYVDYDSGRRPNRDFSRGRGRGSGSSGG